MVQTKGSQVRHVILNRLEDSTYKAGDQLPGTRELAANLKISFLKAQQAIESLVHDGVLEAKARRGTFVRPEWKSRVLPEHISIFNKANVMPWVDGLRDIVAPVLPELRFTHGFRNAMFELKTTLHVQRYHDQYMDLQNLVDNEFFGDAFYQEPIKGFRDEQGRLLGVPFIFSPRVLYLNPELFAKHNIPVPDAGCNWDNLINVIKQWQGILPGHRIINCTRQSFFWQMFVTASGGALFDPSMPGGVGIDSEATHTGLETFKEFESHLDLTKTMLGDSFYQAFIDQEVPMVIAARQFSNVLKHRNYDNWICVPLPRMNDAIHATSQATDLIVVRKGCNNIALAREIIRTLLSEPVQDYMASQSYGIPIRKSSANKSFDLSNPSDAVFASEMKYATCEQLQPDAALVNMVYNGISRLLHEGEDLAVGLAQLADTARIFMSVNRYANQHPTSNSNVTSYRDLP